MKGFAGMLLLFGIVVSAAILLSANTTIKEDYSFKEIIYKTKSHMNNYELTLKRMSAECDWSTTQSAKNCAQDAANSLYLKMSKSEGINCTPTPIISRGNEYTMNLNCKIQSNNRQNAITIDANKDIILRHP